MPRRKKVAISINHERWLVSYSDFITLLFAFFVVMYSISQVSESKYRVLSDTLMDAFSTEQRSMSPIQVGRPALNIDPSVITEEEPDAGEFTGDGAFDKTADLPQLTESISEQFADLIDDDLVQVNSNEFWLQVDINSNVLFSSGKAEPNLQARAIFDEIAQMLKGFDNPIQVEGFTDDVPINTPQFPSNWELSAARAASIVKLLMEGEVAPERLSAVGYGEYRPISDNATEAGRVQNRRVALMISRERIERPRVSELSKVEDAIAPTQFESSQPFAQPGLENAETAAEALPDQEPVIHTYNFTSGGEATIADFDLAKDQVACEVEGFVTDTGSPRFGEMGVEDTAEGVQLDFGNGNTGSIVCKALGQAI